MLEGGFLDYFFDYAVGGMFSDFKTDIFFNLCDMLGHAVDEPSIPHVTNKLESMNLRFK
jgi:hypothetical protein